MRAVDAANALQRSLPVKGEGLSGKSMLAERVASALDLPLRCNTISSRTRRRADLPDLKMIADVLSEEPPVHGNVLLAPALLAEANFILTPHCAWASDPAMQALADQLIDNLEAFAAGRPRNLVT